METRANYVLIGAFTIGGILAVLGFFLWLAKVEIDKQFAYFDVQFESVAGLGEAGDVRFNGLPVGQVVRLGLDPQDRGLVRVTLEVDAGTPIGEGTVARLEFQGVTGVSYVSLEGAGGADLVGGPGPAGPNPLIASEKSAVQSLFEGAPELLERAILLLEDVRGVVNPENRAAITSILANLDSASGELDTVLKDFSALSGDLSEAAGEVAAFTDTLEGLAGTADQTLRSADETLQTATRSLTDAQAVISDASAALNAAKETFDTANAVIESDLSRLIASLDDTATTIGTVVRDVGVRVEDIARLAIRRLDQAEGTIGRLDRAIEQAELTLISADTLTKDLNTLVTEDGAALLADARAAVAAASETMHAMSTIVERDLPAIMSDIRSVTAEADRVVTAVGPQIESSAGNLDTALASADEALRSATDTFTRANTTLAAIDQTLAGADRTLAAATETFEGANEILAQDLSTLAADARLTMASIREAVDEAAGDLPAITGEVETLLTDTQSLIRNLDSIVTANKDEIEVFAKAGLPQFVRFMQEGRKLIANLERLTAKIERDPARFLLGTQAPEFEN